MNKIKVLAIAPYDGMKDLIDEIAKEYNSLEVHSFVGDMMDGVKIVRAKMNEGYDFILSRAGTAELIRNITDVPVIDIKLSVLDMMRTIKLAQNYAGEFAIVGFKSITSPAKTISQLNNQEMNIKTVRQISELESCILDIKKEGVSLIIGDMITINCAKQLGLNTILVTSGKETIQSALVDIITMHKYICDSKKNFLLAKHIIQHSDESIIMFNHFNKPIYSKLEQLDEQKKTIIEELKKHIGILKSERELYMLKRFGKENYKIRGALLNVRGEIYPTFYINKKETAIKAVDKSIEYKNVSELPQIDFNTIQTFNSTLKKIINDVKAFSDTNIPILFMGEKGTGKDLLAFSVYKNSNLKNSPLVIINCNYMNRSKWEKLFESENSPFLDINLTFYFRYLDTLSNKSKERLEEYLSNTLVHKRNRFIFSYTTYTPQAIDEDSLIQFLRNDLGVITFSLPTLNDRKDDIASLTSIILGDLMPKYRKQVLGLMPEALDLLKNFNWRYNIDQLQRVIEQVLILTDDYYIDAKKVEKVLENENRHNIGIKSSLLHGNKTLKEINKKIIEQVLIEENYNQTKAAKRLGISRSTLWRKINEKE